MLLVIKSKINNTDITFSILSAEQINNRVIITIPKDKNDPLDKSKVVYSTLINNGYKPEDYGSFMYCIRLYLSPDEWQNKFHSLHA